MSALVTCPGCGTEVPAEARLCPTCGKHLRLPQRPKDPAKTVMTVAILVLAAAAVGLVVVLLL